MLILNNQAPPCPYFKSGSSWLLCGLDEGFAELFLSCLELTTDRCISLAIARLSPSKDASSWYELFVFLSLNADRWFCLILSFSIFDGPSESYRILCRPLSLPVIKALTLALDLGPRDVQTNESTRLMTRVIDTGTEASRTARSAQPCAALWTDGQDRPPKPLILRTAPRLLPKTTTTQRRLVPKTTTTKRRTKRERGARAYWHMGPTCAAAYASLAATVEAAALLADTCRGEKLVPSCSLLDGEYMLRSILVLPMRVFLCSWSPNKLQKKFMRSYPCSCESLWSYIGDGWW